jgi:signal transduction protein with GAF and PtsI domain
MGSSKTRFEQIPVAVVKKIADRDRDKVPPRKKPVSRSSPSNTSSTPAAFGQEARIRFFDTALQLIQGEGDLKSALAPLVQLAAEAANSNSASFYIVDGKKNVLKPLITYGLPPEYVEACGDVRIGDQCCGRAVQHRTPWIVSDMLKDPLFASARTAATLSPIRSGFSVPVIDQNQECIGSLACHFREPHTPTTEEIERNQTWATLIAHIISEYKRGSSAPPWAIKRATS